MTCRPCLDTYIHTYKQTINQYKQIVIIHKSIETYSYTYTWLQMVRPPQPTHRGGAGTLCVHVVSLCADTKTMTCRPCWDTHILTYQQTDRQTHRHTYINQYKQIVIIHKSIETYSYTYTWLQMVRPPQPTHRGGAGTLCVHVVSLCADTKTMTCRPCLDTYIHTYKQTINQYKQIVIIHKSIETYSYTYTWLQMVRPPQPTHRGGGGNIMCTCSIFVCRHKNNDMSTLLGHAHTYIPTDRQTDTQAYIHKSIQTYSYTYTWLHICDVFPLWGGGWGGTRGGWIIYVLNVNYRSPNIETYGGHIFNELHFMMGQSYHKVCNQLRRKKKPHETPRKRSLTLLRNMCLGFHHHQRCVSAFWTFQFCPFKMRNCSE